MIKKFILSILLPLFLTSCSLPSEHESCIECIDVETTYTDEDYVYVLGLSKRIVTSEGYDFCITNCHFDGNFLNVTYKGYFFINTDNYFSVYIKFNTFYEAETREYFYLSDESKNLLENKAHKVEHQTNQTLFSVEGNLTLTYACKDINNNQKEENIDLKTIDYITYHQDTGGKTAKGRNYYFYHIEYLYESEVY